MGSEQLYGKDSCHSPRPSLPEQARSALIVLLIPAPSFLDSDDGMRWVQLFEIVWKWQLSSLHPSWDSVM